MNINVLRLSESATLPSRASGGAAGYDLYADLETPRTVMAGSWQLIPTGFAFAIPYGTEGQVRSRSGLAFKEGIFVLNGPGTIDSDYRGEVKVLLANFGEWKYVVNPGDRIAQMVFNQVSLVILEEVDDLDKTTRMFGGFGSTGK